MKKFFLLSWLLIVFFNSCKNDTKDILINSLHFDQTKIVMEKGESRTVYISYLPEDATKVDINYSTVNTDVISISGLQFEGVTVDKKASEEFTKQYQQEQLSSRRFLPQFQAYLCT